MSRDIADRRPWIAIVGGFLGAGKTTLILAAAKELERRGIRSAVILNDQGNELVDYRLRHAKRNAIRRSNGRLLLLQAFRFTSCHGRVTRP